MSLIVRRFESREGFSSERGSAASSALIGLLALALVVALAWFGIASRAKAMTVLTRETNELAVPTVSVVRPSRQAPQQDIVLPGSALPFVDAAIYARTGGYLSRRIVDIGARVRAGQMLAEIDAPELQQQIEQARADLAMAEANLRLARITADRYIDLAKSDSVSRQDVDNASGSLEARNAAVESARHNVQRLEQLQSYTKIYAPFDGTITARNTEVGALIDSGAAGGSTRELFHIADTHRLRVFVNLPQVYSRAAKTGMSVDVTLSEFPGRHFAGELVRTTNAIDPVTRTMLTEIDIDNRSGELLPGSYVEVHLTLPTTASTLQLPVPAVLFRSEGVRVAVVRGGNRVELVPVTLGRDFGTQVEVLTGLTGDEQVIANPPDSLAPNQVVRVQESRPASRGGGN